MENVDQIRQIIDSATKIVVVQADNPDADSLGSALALEHILGDLGKQVELYCAVDTPGYLRYMPGWDRISKDLPAQFDASIIVDASTMTLLERLVESGQKGWLAAKPCVVLDHHEIVENPVDFASVTINEPARASTGELIYLLCQELNWSMSPSAQELLALSILGDTQGLSNQLASAQTYRIMADMLEAGVNRPKLEEARRELSKMPPEIFSYKAELIKRTKFSAGGRVASVIVPQAEISRFSPLYNPAPLIQPDMLQTSGVLVAVVFKHYDDGKITGAVRANPAAPVAGQLAESLGGGGHAFASGFKITGGQVMAKIEADCLLRATELLDKL